MVFIFCLFVQPQPQHTEPFAEDTDTLTLETANRYKENMDILIGALAYRLKLLIPSQKDMDNIHKHKAHLKSIASNMNQHTENVKKGKYKKHQIKNATASTSKTTANLTKKNPKAAEKMQQQMETFVAPVTSTSTEKTDLSQQQQQQKNKIMFATIDKLAKPLPPKKGSKGQSHDGTGTGTGTGSGSGTGSDSGTGEHTAGGAGASAEGPSSLPEPLQIYIDSNTKLYQFYNDIVVSFVNSNLDQRDKVHDIKKKQKEHIDHVKNKRAEHKKKAENFKKNSLKRYGIHH